MRNNRAQYILSLFEYEGEKKFRHKVAGVALGLGGLGAAALATHAATKGQSFGASLGDLGHHLSQKLTAPSTTTDTYSYNSQSTGHPHGQSGATPDLYNGHKPTEADMPNIEKSRQAARNQLSQSFQNHPTPGGSTSPQAPSFSAPTKGPGQVMQSTRGLGPVELVQKPSFSAPTPQDLGADKFKAMDKPLGNALDAISRYGTDNRYKP